jgi:hypothetical protein
MTTASLCSPAQRTKPTQTQETIRRPRVRAARRTRTMVPPQGLLPFAVASTAQAQVQDGPAARRPQVLVTRGLKPKAIAAQPSEAGAVIARERFGHTVELVGSCIMLAGFLVLALFG